MRRVKIEMEAETDGEGKQGEERAKQKPLGDTVCLGVKKKSINKIMIMYAYTCTHV